MMMQRQKGYVMIQHVVVGEFLGSLKHSLLEQSIDLNLCLITATSTPQYIMNLV